MTSSVDGVVVPPNYVPSDVQYLLNQWRPRRLHVLEETTSNAPPPPTTITAGTGSTIKSRKKSHKNTRPASFYDMHLAGHLVLKHVKRLDSLVDSMVGTVDKAIKDAFVKGALPPNGSGSLYTEGHIQNRTDNAETILGGEDGVTEYYNNLTANFCLPIASTLALHPTHHEWTSRLSWSQGPNKAGWAIADGVLKLNRAPVAEEIQVTEGYQSILKEIDPDIRNILHELQRRYPDLATWEMKRLDVGDDEVMNNIAQWAHNAHRFFWIICGGDCGRSEEHKNMYKSQDQLPMGYDALQPPWTLDPGGDPDSHSSSRRSGRLTSRPAISSTAPPVTESGLSDSSLSSLNGEDDRGAKGRKRKRVTGKDKKKKKDSDSSYQDNRRERRYVNAQLFLQQAWAQGVRNGSTILVLHSGNHEFIGVRHRATQTLYLSDLIVPSSCEPAYGKIHVGIYIAAIKDALDRVRQDIKADEERDGAEDKVGDRDGEGDGNKDEEDEEDENEGRRRKRRKQNGAKDSKQGKRRAPAPRSSGQQGREKGGKTRSGHQVTHNEAATRNTAFIHFCYGIYASACPATFVRKTTVVDTPTQETPPPTSPGQTNSMLSDSIDITLTSEMRPGSTGIVHIGTMEVEPSGRREQVAVKFAFSEYEKKTLEHEHKIYSHLHSQGVQGIPQDFGLFVDDELVDNGEGPYALIMSFAGDSLFRRESHVLPSVKTSLLTTLKSIHKAGVIHGDIRLPNLCATTSGEAFIIDFSHARQSTSRSAKAFEIKDICRLLDIEDSKPRSKPVLKDEPAGLRRSSRLKQLREKAETKQIVTVRGRRRVAA